MYDYAVRGCPGVNETVVMSVNDSSIRRHTIQNSPETPIEEDSVYNVTLIAVDFAGINSSMISTTIQTPQAGTSMTSFLSCREKIIIIPLSFL